MTHDGLDLGLRHLAGTGCIRWSKRTIWNVDLPPQLFFLRAAVLPRWPLTSANLIYQMKVYSNALMGLLLSHGNTNMNSWVRDVSDSGEMHINKNCYTREVWQEEKYNKNAYWYQKLGFISRVLVWNLSPNKTLCQLLYLDVKLSIFTTRWILINVPSIQNRL